MYQHVQNVSIRKREERPRLRKIIEGIMAKILSNLMENNLCAKTLKKFQV